MNVQAIIVIAIIFAACIYTGLQLRRKSRSFSLKKDCGDDCGCNGESKKLLS